MNCVKAACKDPRFVAGAGATEVELSRQVKSFGEATPGLDQYAIKKFGDALEIVPRILAENAGKMATEVISSLYAAHAAGHVNAGVDVDVRLRLLEMVFLVLFLFGQNWNLTHCAVSPVSNI